MSVAAAKIGNYKKIETRLEIALKAVIEFPTGQNICVTIFLSVDLNSTKKSFVFIVRKLLLL